MQSSQPNTDEIDLLHMLASLTRFLLRNWLIIVLSIGSCITLSWLSFRRTPKVFAGEMFVQSRFLSETYAGQVVKAFQKQINQGNHGAISAQLNLTTEEASLLQNISVTSPFSEKAGIREEGKIVFILSAEVSDPIVLPKLQLGLISFFENIEYVKLRVTAKRKSYQNLIARIDREVDRFDGLTPAASAGRLFPSIPNKRPGNQYPALVDPSTADILLTRERNEAQEELAILFNGIEVIQGFNSPKTPVGPDFSIYLASGFSSGVLLSLLLLGLRSVQWLFKKYPA